MALKQVQTTCAYCGAGCQIMFTVDTDANKIVEAVPADGRTNAGTLCLKVITAGIILMIPRFLRNVFVNR